MRSRYTAFVRRDTAYLLRTWKASRRPESLDLDETTWLGLEVLSTDAGGAEDTRGTVDFIARYEVVGGAVGVVREHSRFIRQAGEWVYIDGETPR